MEQQTIQRFEALVNSIPLPRRSIKVFGAIRVNIHVECESRETAYKWVGALKKVTGDVKAVETSFYAKDQASRVTVNLKMIHGYRVYARV